MTDLAFLVEVNRGTDWEVTTYHPRSLEDAIILRDLMKREFPSFKYRVSSVLPEEYFATVA